MPALACAAAAGLSTTSIAQAAGPVLTSISPNDGSAGGGTPVTISGSGFTVGSSVKFGAGTGTGVTVHSAESITVTSPAGSGSEPVNVTVTNSAGTSPTTPRDQFAYNPNPATAWLGLNGNSGGAPQGRVREFAAKGIVYDRGGAPWLDWQAGQPLEESGRETEGGLALATSAAAGMIPDVTIEYDAYEGHFSSDPDFPQERTKAQEKRGKETISGYVEGFLASAKAIHAKYPSAIFEPMNEPWGYTKPQYNAAEYAAVIAQLLPEAKAAGIPLSSIYVGATGANCSAPAKGHGHRESTECTSDGWVPAMYAAEPQLETEIEGWYLHPYGPPSGGEDGSGIQSVPAIQQEMTSGQNNIVVSEVGYCAANVNGGAGCTGDDDETGTEAARHLTEMLDSALPYHQAGWLRALLVYARSAGGWAMQLSDGALTAQGQALESFALSLQPPTREFYPGSAGQFQLTEPI
jgi:IPT/TIG domain